MIANLSFWNKTIYRKVAGYLRGLAQLSIFWRYALSLDCQLIASAAWPPSQAQNTRPATIPSMFTWQHCSSFLLVPCFTISLTICLEHIFIENVMCLYLFNESLGLFSSRGWCPRWMLVFSVGQCRQYNRTMNQSILRNFHQFWILNLPNLWKEA